MPSYGHQMEATCSLKMPFTGGGLYQEGEVIRTVLLHIVWDNSLWPPNPLTRPLDAWYAWNQLFPITISSGTYRCRHTMFCSCSSACSSCSESGCINATESSAVPPALRCRPALTSPVVSSHAPH